MGIAAFLFFVLPWMAFAAWMYTLPSAIRLGTPPTPWRPLANYAVLTDGAHNEATTRIVSNTLAPVEPLAPSAEHAGTMPQASIVEPVVPPSEASARQSTIVVGRGSLPRSEG